MTGTQLRALTGRLWATSEVVFVVNGQVVRYACHELIQNKTNGEGDEPPTIQGAPVLYIHLGECHAAEPVVEAPAEAVPVT